MSGVPRVLLDDQAATGIADYPIACEFTTSPVDAHANVAVVLD